ncbi:MAG: trypsin-like peptidase domain-containing protein [Cyanobacteria bacterium P01_H01_bin.74]
MNRLLTLGLTVALSFSSFSFLLAGLPTDNALAARPFNQAYPAQFTPNLIADIAEAIAPAVVNIDVNRKYAVSTPSGFPFGDEIFRRFFGMAPRGNEGFIPFDSQQPNLRRAPLKRKSIVKGNGSGMILNTNGTILTNSHVVRRADAITVTLNDGRKYPAKLLGMDKLSDMAVLKIDAPNLKAVTLGDSDSLRPGEWVIAIGSPLGFDHSVTQGIISALSRRIPDLNANLSFIQTDAAINPGNSGGPLVNLKGEVIGINTAISGQGQNIGFAIPVNTVKTIADTLIAGKPVVRPWVGIAMISLNAELAEQVGLPTDASGILIDQIMPQSPAYKAGLMRGDIIQKVDGAAIKKAEAFQSLVKEKPVNTAITLDILRNGHPISVAVTTEQRPEPDASKP